MLNLASLQAVASAKFSQNFIRPLYHSYCFSNIPATLQFLLTNTGHVPFPPDVLDTLPTSYDNVVLFFVDAFGWRFFQRYADSYSLLKRFSTQGRVSKLTSQFPSTTAAHVTCLHTGLDVGQSGVYEWNYYEPLVDNIISPLLFSYSADKVTRDTLKRAAIPASHYFPQQTFYQTLRQLGVQSHILQSQTYTPSTYSNVVFRGATVHPYSTLAEACKTLLTLLTTRTQTPGYYYLYFDRIDTACHNHGPSSWQFEKAVDAFFQQLEQLFFKQLRGKAMNTLFIMTADHGQVEVEPQNTYYLNIQFPDIVRYLKTNRQGTVLVPAGSARDMFLYVKEEYVDKLVVELQQRLLGRAEVYRTSELLNEHFFGKQLPSATFLERVGNVVILPYKNESVWWYEEGKFTMRFQGHHGGLTPEEMEIPLLLLPL